MRRLLLISSVVAALPVAAWSADLTPITKAPAPTPAPSPWTGSYVGLNAGYTWGSNSSSFTFFPEDFGSFGFPASATLNNGGFIGGAQWGYNYQLGNIVIGTESDFEWLSNSSTTTGFSNLTTPPGTLTRTDKVEWLSTLRGRLGFTPTDRLLVYGTGGVAGGVVSTSTNVTFPAISYIGSDSDTRVGWTAGVGAEYAITSNLSARAEYLYYDLGGVTVVGLPTGTNPDSSHTHFDVAGSIIRAGLDYKIDLLGLLFPGTAAPAPGVVTKAPPAVRELQVETGARYWYSTGKTQKDLFNVGGAGQLSQLTYGDLSANSGESFGRADHVSGVFLKGNFGAGKVNGGNLNDEDFTVPPSSTFSDQKDGTLGYATIDLGYSFLRGAGYRLGVFGGYNYYHEKLNAEGCTQTTTSTVCVPSITDAVLAITNDNTWNSARLGLNGDVMLSDRIKLSADAAWLPYSQLSGSDTHWLRTNSFIPGDFAGPISQDGSGHQGVQLEAILSYEVAPGFSLGAGGRYWYMQASGNTQETFTGGGAATLPTDFKTERYGGFVQGSFKF